MSWAGGKGDKRRPAAVDEQTLSDNWNRIFGAKPEGSPHEEEHHGEAAEVPDESGV